MRANKRFGVSKLLARYRELSEPQKSVVGLFIRQAADLSRNWAA